VTLTVHDPLAGIEAPQVPVWPNGPLTASCDTDAALGFGLDTVTVCTGLADPLVSGLKMLVKGTGACATVGIPLPRFIPVVAEV
jgi:hypothetical protein